MSAIPPRLRIVDEYSTHPQVLQLKFCFACAVFGHGQGASGDVDTYDDADGDGSAGFQTAYGEGGGSVMEGKTMYMTVLIVSVGVLSWLIRALPFLLFGRGGEPPKVVSYGGPGLSPAAIAMPS